MQARVFGCPSTITRQSKQTPIPQKTELMDPTALDPNARQPRLQSAAARFNPSATRKSSPLISMLRYGSLEEAPDALDLCPDLDWLLWRFIQHRLFRVYPQNAPIALS